MRPAFHNNVTKRYRGGTARKTWKFVEGAPEAVCLTCDYAGESHSPQWWNGRVSFVSDRDGTMNLWSMDEGGQDLRQHTHHSGWDVRDPALDRGRLVYQVGADLWLYDIASGMERRLPIRLASDFDQLREKWVKKPMEYLTSAHLHPKGDAVVLTARGRVFVAPAAQGRLVRASREPGVRYRDAVFLPDGKRLLGLSDASGELEFVTLPANGVGDPIALTSDGKVLRFEGVPSPDGKWVAYTDNNNDLWLLNVATKAQTLLSPNRQGSSDVAWSPDSRFLAWSQAAANSFDQVLRLRTRGEDPHAGDQRPRQQPERGLEPRRRMALLPLRPQPRVGRGRSLGTAPARALLRQADEALPGGAAEGAAIALQARRRAAPGGARGEEAGAGREEGGRQEGRHRVEGQGGRRRGSEAAAGHRRHGRPRPASLRGAPAGGRLRRSRREREGALLAGAGAGQRRTSST